MFMFAGAKSRAFAAVVALAAIVLLLQAYAHTLTIAVSVARTIGARRATDASLSAASTAAASSVHNMRIKRPPSQKVPLVLPLVSLSPPQVRALGAPHARVFQHNTHVPVNSTTYTFVLAYRRRLLQLLTALLTNLGIRHVIAHGNLIEYERGTPSVHDDDVDIRFDVRDFDKWSGYCLGADAVLADPSVRIADASLHWDERLMDMRRQRHDAIQARLQVTTHATHPFNVDVHADVVASVVRMKSTWLDYKVVDFDALRRVTYLGVETYAPSTRDTETVLAAEYGADWRHNTSSLPDAMHDPDPERSALEAAVVHLKQLAALQRAKRAAASDDERSRIASEEQWLKAELRRHDG